MTENTARTTPTDQPTDLPELPTGIDDGATVVVRRETRIDAPIEQVWRLHTDVDAWPAWQTDVDAARTDGPLQPGTNFRWSTHGLDVTSTVYALDAPHRILWGGPAMGIDGIHEWTFAADGDATVVRTAESWEGDPVRADADNLRASLEASLGSWLELLRQTAETKASDTKAAERRKRKKRRRAAKGMAWVALVVTAAFILTEPWLMVPVLLFVAALSLWS